MKNGARSAAVAALLCVVVPGCGASHTATSAPQSAGPAKKPTNGLLGQPSLRLGEAADFSLRDQHGRTVRLAGQRGRIVVLTFLYTSCPDVCPLTAAKLGLAARRLGPLARRLRIIAVSVDPDNDTPANVSRFVAEYRLPSQFHYLTGTRKQLQPVWQSYNVLVERRNLERLDHSIPIVVIDAQGRPREYFDHSATPAAIAHDVRLLLKRV
jgi:protein SCO1/2